MAAQQDEAPRLASSMRVTETGVKWLRQSLDYGLYLALALVVVTAAILSPAFFRPGNLLNVLRQASPLGIVSLGQTIVILAGGIDLSVSGVISMTTVVTADLTGGANAYALPVTIICLMFGAFVGLLNGLLITKRNVPPFIATLGMAIVLEGVRLVYTKAAPSGYIPEVLRFIGRGTIGPIPTSAILFAVLAVAVSVMLRKSVFGRQIYATGGNEEAARLSGVPVSHIVVMTYVLSGVFASLAGLVLAGYIGYADNFLGRGFEFDSIAAVLVGGASFAGGRGGVAGTVVGVLIMTILFNIVLLLNLPIEYQLVTKGAVIILAVTLYSVRQRYA